MLDQRLPDGRRRRRSSVEFLETFHEFPPRQKAASFTIDQVVGEGWRRRSLPATEQSDRRRDGIGRPARSGWARIATIPRRRRPTGWRSTGSGSIRYQVTNADFAAFVERHGYVTVAERPLDPADFPGAPPENLVPGSLVFTMTAGPVDLRHLGQWWTWTPGACWRRPEGPGSSLDGRDRSSGRPRRATRTPRPTRPGPARRCRPRPSGSWPPAAASTARTTSGATSPSTEVSGWRTTGTASSPGGPSRGYGDHSAGRHRSRPTGTACSTWPATSGSGRPTGTPTRHPEGADSAVLRAREPAGGRRGSSYDPAQPQFRIPRKVIKGGSFLCADSYCMRYRPAARRPQMIDTGMSHIGFRCVARP